MYHGLLRNVVPMLRPEWVRSGISLETASGIRYPNGARTLTSVNYDVSGLNVSTVVTQYTSSTGENCYLFTLDRRTTPNMAIYEDGRGARLTISDTDTETVTIMCPDGSEHTVTTTVPGADRGVLEPRQ